MRMILELIVQNQWLNGNPGDFLPPGWGPRKSPNFYGFWALLTLIRFKEKWASKMVLAKYIYDYAHTCI